MTALEKAINARGYVRCPNRSTRWYAGSGGLPECPSGFEVHVQQDHIEILPDPWHSSRPVAIATFRNDADLFAWLSDHGKISEPGSTQPNWID